MSPVPGTGNWYCSSQGLGMRAVLACMCCIPLFPVYLSWAAQARKKYSVVSKTQSLVGSGLASFTWWASTSDCNCGRDLRLSRCCGAVAGNFGSQLGNVITRHATKRAQHTVVTGSGNGSSQLCHKNRIAGPSQAWPQRTTVPGPADLGLRDGHLAI